MIRVALIVVAAACGAVACLRRGGEVGDNALWLAVFLGLLAAFPKVWLG